LELSSTSDTDTSLTPFEILCFSALGLIVALNSCLAQEWRARRASMSDDDDDEDEDDTPKKGPAAGGGKA
jgi:hypothetical protein